MSLLDEWKSGYIDYSQTKSHRNKVEKSKHLIEKALSNSKKPYVAFSTGKDSLCMLHMVYDLFPQVSVMFHDSGVELPESYTQLQKIKDNWGLNLHIVKNELDVLELYKDLDIFHDDTQERYIQKITLNNPINKYVKQNGFDLLFLGLRKQESRRRKMMLCIHGDYFYCKSNGLFECNPLSDWKKEDIFAYIFSHYPLENLIHPAYYKDKLVKDAGDIRISWWCETNCITKGQFLWLKIYYPDLYNKLANMFIEVKSFI